MAKTKEFTLDQVYFHANNLTTAEQVALKQFLEELLSKKAAKAKEEIELINS